MKKSIIAGLVFLMTFALTGCGDKEQRGSERVNLVVSAAASLKDTAEELKSAYMKQHPDVGITYNFASSGTLQKQIEEGAPADLFISAGKIQMDALAGKSLLLESSRRDLLGNELVLIVKNDSNLKSFEELTGPDVQKMSIGTPETVPAGKYAQEALTSLKLWDKVRPKLVLAKDVRQILTYVETGNVDAGLVYHSDALMGKDIKVAAAAPAGSHKPIVYPMAIIKSTKHPKETEALATFLSGEEAAQIFIKYGFKPLKKLKV